MVMEAQLRDLLVRLAPTEAQRLARRAADLEKADPSQAENLYRQALAQDDRLDAALVGLARVLLSRRKEEEAKQLLENVAAGGALADEVDRLNALILLQQRARECSGDETALRQQIQADPDRAQPRYELGCLLAAKGDYPHALELLLSAGERDYKLLTSKVREMMVQIFHLVGTQSPLANDYRQRLAGLLY
jgi:thioredoxin-like negative regulator of GroEL